MCGVKGPQSNVLLHLLDYQMNACDNGVPRHDVRNYVSSVVAVVVSSSGLLPLIIIIQDMKSGDEVADQA